MAMGWYLSVITLNVNGLNAPTKRQRLAEWIQKQYPYICCLQETHLKTRDTYRLKVKGWKKIFHANKDQKKAGVAILISDKIDFKTKAVKRIYAFELWCWRRLESPLDCKEIQPVHSEGDQPWDFFGRNDAKDETAVLWPPHAKS